MFEKGITSENRTFIDRLTSTYIITFIIMLTPSAIFMMYRNDFGPFENLNLVIGIYSVQLFGRISTVLMLLQMMFAWYITEKVAKIILKHPLEFDIEGTIQCSQFFTSDF